MKCRNCIYYCFNMIFNVYDFSKSFCGTHGMCEVDPDGPQVDLDHRGSCGYYPKIKYIQLSFNFDD